MKKIKLIQSILTILVTISQVECCQDSSDKVDIGWKNNPTCKQIRKKYTNLCEKKNLVKTECQKSCGTCGFDPFDACQDSKGKFIVEGSEKKCMNASKKTWLCNKEAFIFNCPKTCDVCNVDDGGNGKDDDGNTSTSLECSGEAPDCCMGLTNTCDLRIDELFFAAMHNANSDENKWNSNHKAPLELALQEGFRAFYLDVCLCNGQIVFCHGNCFWAGTQDPTEVFKNVVAFLKDNPSELVIFNFEISYGNPTPLQLWDVMKQVNGLKNKSYIHHGGGWPKLKGLLQSGKQIISLKHNGNGCLDTASSGCTPYIQEFFKYTVGTKYDFNSISEIEDVQNSCVGERGTAYQQKFFAINNFVTTDFPGPTEGASTTLNQESFMKNRITQCEKKMGRNANFFAVDFWQHGDVPKVAKEINMERGARR